MSIVKAESLLKNYKTGLFKGSITALDNLSLNLEKGQIFGLLGPNGSGKTTTIRILLGLETPDKGSAKIFDFTAGSAKARGCTGYLAEENRLMDWLTPLEVLEFFEGC